jgi:septal ring factor EnvC (AmiA/AmiB activator)
MGDRYANVPISEKTRAGMSLNIDDLGAIGRLLSLQDDAYDEQFEKVFTAIEKQNEIIFSILQTVVELKQDISELKDKVSGLEAQITQITTAVDCTKVEVDEIKREVEKLKKLNTPFVIFLRIIGGVLTALGLIRWIHGPF